MPFPEVKRVIYQKNPLDQVICQLRFPPILKIEAEIPAEFQDRIREHFPNYSETSELKIEFLQGKKQPIPLDLIGQVLQSSGGKNYEFLSEDGLWKINLTRTFIALTANKYRRWEQFKEKLAIPLGALIQVYTPSSFSRIGLRYINVINRSRLGLTDSNWNELLKPHVLGILASEVGSHVQNFENRYEIGLSDGESVVRMVTGFVESADNSEVHYRIDSDFYNGNKTPIEATTEKLDYFNVRGSRLFQWCITERLHQAMEPQVL